MNILTAIREEMLIPIHPAGWPFIGLFGVLTLVLGFSFGPFFLDWRASDALVRLFFPQS